MAVLRDDGGAAGNVRMVVAPNGVNEYPKYLAHFDNVVAYRVCNEMVAPTVEYLGVNTNDCCAFVCAVSPWLGDLTDCRDFVPAPASHYVVFGGDVVVDVIAANPPTFETVEGPTLIEVQYQA